MAQNLWRSKFLVFGTVFLFVFCLFSDVFARQNPPEQSQAEKLLTEGKKLYADGEYEKAIVVLSEALNLTKKGPAPPKAVVESIYLNLALAYFGIGAAGRSKENLAKLFEVNPGYTIDEAAQSPDFVQLFNDVKKISVKPVAIPAPPRPEPGPKKGKFPWLIVGGLAVVGVVVAVLVLGKKSQDSTSPSTPSATTGNIQINSTPTGAQVYLDDTDTGKTTDCTLTNVSTGTHQVRLVLQNYGKWEGSVEVKANQTASVSATLSAFVYEFVQAWGQGGSGDGSFGGPMDVAVDTSGNVYVVDLGNYRVQKFTSSGTFLKTWGSKGSGNGYFNATGAVAVDNLGYVYVAEPVVNHRVQKFTTEGTYSGKWGSLGTGHYQFSGPWGIAASSAGYVYVADSGNNRIMKYDTNGSYVTQWGGSGSAEGQFNDPEGIALDGSGSVYVADYGNHRVQKFNTSGGFLAKWGNSGTADGQLNKPMGIGVDSAGYVFVADSSNHRVQKFSSSGSFVTKWGTNGSGQSQFQYPAGIALDTSGNVYVSDLENNRIQKFRITTRTQALAPATISYSPRPPRANAVSRPGASKTAFPQDSRTRSKSKRKNEPPIKKEKS